VGRKNSKNSLRCAV